MKRENKERGYFIYLNFLIMFFLSIATLQAQGPVKNGVLDLSQEEFRNRIVKLNGEWEFYWEKHLRPADFSGTDIPVPDALSPVPSYWLTLKDEIPEIEKTGYASYRMKLFLPENTGELIFDIPVFDSAFRIYIDGKLAGGNGLAGKNEELSKPGYNPFIYRYTARESEIEIIINVSNYHHRRAGFWLPMRMGEADEMLQWVERRNVISDINAGIIISFISFFLLFYLLFRRDDSMLFFSLATFGILIRFISTGSFLILSLMDLSWISLVRLEYSGNFLALIFISWFFHRIYPDRYYKIFCTVITVLFTLSILLVLASPVIIFANAVRIFYPTVALVLLYYGIKSFLSLLKGQRTGILNIIGFVVVMAGAFNDIGLSRSKILFTDSFILPYATTIFIFIQVIILISRWVHSFNEEKRLSEELDHVNRNLEDMVIERTYELTNQKSEIEKQKDEIEHKNSMLEKSMQIKNRIFSIIAHDLKAPIANLSMLIELMKMEEGEKENTEIRGDLEKQVDFAANLIDNLLLWGQGQQDRIEHHPGKWNITDIVLDTFNIMNSQAERKGIELSFTHRGSTLAWFDRDLVSIILRNLISNAIKFTQEKGVITVLAEQIPDTGPDIKISVRDNGRGMDADNLEKLVKRSVIKSTTGTNGERGTGLGLQLCYDLVRVNRGEMHISSSKGEGTTVSFTLPLHE
ncbi:MAG: ATP-binding protein [Bacteroidales bacterium]|nr:ATP-binding protein [Bacteroidales bacterium]